MVNARRFLLPLISSHLQAPMQDVTKSQDARAIAIIGAGSAGLASLKAILDLPESSRQGWKVVLFEQRHDLGGIWLPDNDNPSDPPEIPQTPLYPSLRTNTPVPSMTYPGFPFPPNTPLYAPHAHVETYHTRFASHYNLTGYIRFKHEVLNTSWIGGPDTGHWDIRYRDGEKMIEHENFQHLIVATGNNHLPRIPTWPGQQAWLKNSPPQGLKREILHSIWYRDPQRYAGRSVLIVGIGSSGRDIMSQISPVSRKTFVSARHVPDPKDVPIPEGVELKPEISHFTTDAVIYRDGTKSHVDVVLLATGYEIRKPFLEAGNMLATNRSAHSNDPDKLTTNTRYLFPLHRHILSLSASYPLNALAFIGLPSAIANCPSDLAQSLYVTHAILNPSLFPSRSQLLKELADHEEKLRNGGYDPYIIGHMLPPGTSHDYQDELLSYLKEKGAIPDEGKNFVEGWRRDILTYHYLKRGWNRIETLGTQYEWLNGVKTEEQWAHMMGRINKWQEVWEKAHTIPFMLDWDLAVS